jgi:hypothetical protein
MYACKEMGTMQAAVSNGRLKTWQVRVMGHIWQFNAVIVLDWKSIFVCAKNNHPSKLFIFLFNNSSLL